MEEKLIVELDLLKTAKEAIENGKMEEAETALVQLKNQQSHHWDGPENLDLLTAETKRRNLEPYFRYSFSGVKHLEEGRPEKMYSQWELGGRFPKEVFKENPHRFSPKTAILSSQKTGRNEFCPCGSRRKYKKCSLAFTQAFFI